MRPFGAVGRALLPRFGQFDHEALVFRRDRRPAQGFDESGRGTSADLEIALVRGEPDGTDLGSGHVAIAADERQQPARIGVVTPPGIDPKPARAFEPGARPAIAATLVTPA